MELNVSSLIHNQNSAIRVSSSNQCFRNEFFKSMHGVRFDRNKLGFRRVSRVVAVDVMSNEESLVKEKEKKKKVSVNPVYTPTPPNRELRTPHSGYHFDGSARKFFEGWYFKVGIPETRQSFCFMYSVENPAFRKKLSTLEVATHGPRFTGVGAQILGADDKYICQFSEESKNFWGSRHELVLGSTFKAEENMKPPNREVPPQEFRDRVSEGFQVSPLWHQGSIQDNGRTSYAETVKSARWEYSTRPVYGWGDVSSKQKATAGWLAAFPVFEPHWQICMASGLSTGWIEWDGELFEFENAPSYSEKNWGGAFPKKWFWVQCNNFEGADGEIALTAAGGLRELPGLNSFENAALIGVHYGGVFYEFVPWNGVVSWEIAPWGRWRISADNQRHKVELEATTKDPGTTLRAPTLEAGLAPACKDTCFGDLSLRIWERKYDGSKGKAIDALTSLFVLVEDHEGIFANLHKEATLGTSGLYSLATGNSVNMEEEKPHSFLLDLQQ
ncbi:Tocopherol cyclase protein [Thalictrum thalictroides]|uniref:Tocopherol cyclase protein n=1 Tax=Thalictrum thalictroides TaxID=46969 RepID=A0A7J6WNA4_THATH|nr:Tocopherol cyclase protein [Thalictrum thalictroides]